MTSSSNNEVRHNMNLKLITEQIDKVMNIIHLTQLDTWEQFTLYLNMLRYFACEQCGMDNNELIKVCYNAYTTAAGESNNLQHTSSQILENKSVEVLNFEPQSDFCIELYKIIRETSDKFKKKPKETFVQIVGLFRLIYNLDTTEAQMVYLDRRSNLKNKLKG